METLYSDTNKERFAVPTEELGMYRDCGREGSGLRVDALKQWIRK